MLLYHSMLPMFQQVVVVRHSSSSIKHQYTNPSPIKSSSSSKSTYNTTSQSSHATRKAVLMRVIIADNLLGLGRGRGEGLTTTTRLTYLENNKHQKAILFKPALAKSISVNKARGWILGWGYSRWDGLIIRSSLVKDELTISHVVVFS